MNSYPESDATAILPPTPAANLPATDSLIDLPRHQGAASPAALRRVSPEEARRAKFLRQMAWRFEEAERLGALPSPARNLYADLVAMRGRIALDGGVPAYRILTNRQVLKIVEAAVAALSKDALALTDAALMREVGLNSIKVESFGAELSALANRHLRRLTAKDS